MKLVRKIVFPFSAVYGGVTRVRNYCFDQGWWESQAYALPVICVGNLSVGGTGKSPMIEWLIRLLKEDYKVAVLSRGYKRTTSGFIEVQTSHSAAQVGDEPLQFKEKFPEVTIAVCADRRTGIAQLKKSADLILLDDAFQHRKVHPSLSILLTPFSDPYFKDFLLPAGNLREARKGAERADIIIATKVPPRTPYAKMQEFKFLVNANVEQHVYFSKIGYSKVLKGKTEELALDYLINKKFTLVTGIANPAPLVRFLKAQNFNFEHKKYPDHHSFSETELADLMKEQLLITTEKDYMRLKDRLKKYALYFLPITTEILNNQEQFLKEHVLAHIRNFKN
jgi:tetraacyldisaccharide 4'-kinase